MLAQYLLYNNEILFYIDHIFYRLDKIKIAFENHCLIDVNLFWPIWNYLKFHAIIDFIKYIWDYGSIINYNTTLNKIAHKYSFQAFYRWINKKKYKLSILEYNICNTIVIAI